MDQKLFFCTSFSDDVQTLKLQLPLNDLEKLDPEVLFITIEFELNGRSIRSEGRMNDFEKLLKNIVEIKAKDKNADINPCFNGNPIADKQRYGDQSSAFEFFANLGNIDTLSVLALIRPNEINDLVWELLGTHGSNGYDNPSPDNLTPHGNEIWNRLSGIGHVARWQLQRSIANNQLDLLTSAINAFEQAWPTDPHAVSSPWADSFSNSLGKNNDPFCLIKAALLQTRGAGIVRNLWEFFNTSEGSLNAEFDPIQTTRNIASTPVFFATERDGNTGGNVLWLTVELFQDGFGSGFAPCPMTLGLTSIIKELPDAQGVLQDLSFLKAMDKAWRLSGVANRNEELGRYNRGRWTLTHQPLFECEARVKELDANFKKFFPPYLSGGSAETAALVAILAASGCIPYSDNDEFHLEKIEENQRVRYRSMTLVPSVGATATLVQGESTSSYPVELELGIVFECDSKLAAAQQYKLSTQAESTLLDTMIIADIEAKETEAVRTRVKKSKEEAEKSRASKSPYRGITFHASKTVGDVLHWMLSVNRVKAAIHDKRKGDWERKWAKLRIPLTNPDGTIIAEDPDAPNRHQDVSSGSLEYLRFVEKNPKEIDNPKFVDPTEQTKSMIEDTAR